MFGKRSISDARDKGQAAMASLVMAPKLAGLPAIQSAPPPQQAPAPEPQRSDDYYVTKSMIFGALVEAIDLSQLSRLDAENAREEIRETARMRSSRSRTLPCRSANKHPYHDICNDVLGDWASRTAAWP